MIDLFVLQHADLFVFSLSLFVGSVTLWLASICIAVCVAPVYYLSCRAFDAVANRPRLMLSAACFVLGVILAELAIIINHMLRAIV